MSVAITKFDELLKFLTDTRVPHRIDPDRQLIEVPGEGPPLPGNLYIKWEKHVPFLQLIHFMIEDVPAEREHELERAIVRLDNILEVGGFGFEYERRRLYCRLSVPVYRPEGITPTTLDRLCRGIVENARSYVDVFAQVVTGTPGDQVVAIAQEIMARRNADVTKRSPAPTE